ncbi:MAG: aquaporin [Bacilli bacterium]|nr:aquaporin [Bacilli bacterium]
MSLLKKCIVEAIGTAFLTLFACGVAVLSGADIVATSLAFGLVIVVVAYTFGSISGCHINPAVSLAMWIKGEMSLKEMLAYMGAQVVGALVGSALLGLFLVNVAPFNALGGNEIQYAFAINMSGDLNAWSYIGAFLVEILLTFVFVFVILWVTDKKNYSGKNAPLFIGTALAFVHMLGLGFTGTSVNPARSLAPALLQAFAGETTSLEQVWIWILAPLAGGALAALVYKALQGKKKEEPKAEEPKAE